MAIIMVGNNETVPRSFGHASESSEGVSEKIILSIKER
jgi:hypothetical protein